VAPGEILAALRPKKDAMISLLRELVEAESPTDVPASQVRAREILVRTWAEAGFRHRYVTGRDTGGHLLFAPAERRRGHALQVMVGHLDTVWPLGTLERMPVVEADGILRGPGVFDMKGGLVQMIFAVRALRELGVGLPATPLAFVNSDEEVGSPESRHLVRRLARAASRAFILEPSFGPEGLIKTARKGVGRFTVTVRGRASHAGLEPEAGLSAILELSHVIQSLHALTDLERGLSVNVGVIEGGTRANVVAAESRAQVDVRAMTLEDARWVTEAIHALRPEEEDVTLEVTGGFEVPPLERTPRNRALWLQAETLGRELGLELGEVTAGGGSDGNTTSQFTATLDGLGPRGDGAHADREHVVVESLVERTALLAGLLASPLADPVPAQGS
jgi:glutamate carboxypeptidase